jgi:uncharacterized protein (DUF924 family)
MASPETVLDFWFGAPGTADRDSPRPVWFRSNGEFDEACRAHLAALHADAASGALDHWGETPEGALALVILLDQMPRNLHRGQAAAFACDAMARAAARRAVARAFDRTLAPVRRQFLYLPFEHSEDLADQEEGIRLFASLPPGGFRDRSLEYARRHANVVRRFGRFPHRNAALGRATIAEEAMFLASPEAPF